ncbi:MAG: DUF2997 domain-containing protein [Actinomyces dentalis]
MSTAHPDGPARRALKVSVAPDGTVTAETIGFTGSACLSQIGVLEDLLEATTVRSAFTDEYFAAQTRTRSEARVTTREGMDLGT